MLLPEKLQKISKPFCELADVVMELPDCDQKLFALQKLLEAKDCAVRCGVNGKIVELKKGDVIRFGDDPSTEELMSFYKGKLYMYNEFEEIYKYFKYDHLPEKLQKISKPFCELADVVMELPDCDQKLFALQKLLEAKDCAVRCGV